MSSSTPCTLHPSYDADYCPVCGTTTPIGDRVPMTREDRAAAFVARTRAAMEADANGERGFDAVDSLIDALDMIDALSGRAS